MRGIEAIRLGRVGPPTPITYERMRAVGQIIKETIDKRRSFPLFQIVDDFVRKMLTKYLPP